MIENTLGLITIFIWAKNIFFLEYLETYFKNFFLEFFSCDHCVARLAQSRLVLFSVVWPH